MDQKNQMIEKIRESDDQMEGERSMNFLEIEKVIGREILDSRGNPTVEAGGHTCGWHRGKRHGTVRRFDGRV